MILYIVAPDILITTEADVANAQLGHNGYGRTYRSVLGEAQDIDMYFDSPTPPIRSLRLLLEVSGSGMRACTIVTPVGGLRYHQDSPRIVACKNFDTGPSADYG